MKTVSAIVPVLDEAIRLPGLLAELRELPLHEVIVVDGGSVDGSIEAARIASATVLSGRRGRGTQLNLGASAATGEVLWFVHADARPPADAVRWIRDALADPATVGGAFRLHTVSDGGRYRLGPLLRVADVRSRLTRHPYGDQAMFVRRSAFEQVGGFRDIPLMEDLALSQALAAIGRLRTVPATVRVSGRRFEERPLTSFVLMNLFPTLFRLGVSPARLARWYGSVR